MITQSTFHYSGVPSYVCPVKILGVDSPLIVNNKECYFPLSLHC
jgi:hypothetical protein